MMRTLFPISLRRSIILGLYAGLKSAEHCYG